MDDFHHDRTHPAHHPHIERFNEPIIIFLTVCAKDRKPVLATSTVHAGLREAWQTTSQWRVGKYMIMPDHIHLLWLGLAEGSDQRNGMKHFRQRLNPVLEKLGTALQKQPYDHVLCADERQPAAFEAVVEYIAQNPERAGLVGPDQFRTYPFTNCLMPGFPELTLWQPDFWDRFDRIASSLRKQGFQRLIAGSERDEE